MKNVLVFCILFLGLLMAPLSTSFAQSSGNDPEMGFFAHRIAPVGGAIPIQSNDSIGTIRFAALVGSNQLTRPGATIRSIARGPVTPTSLAANLVFQTSSSTQALRDRMIITETGLVGIGTVTPTFHLHTVGNTHTTGDFYGRIHMDVNPNNDAPNTYIDETYFERKNRSILAVPAAPDGGTAGGLMTLAPGGTSNDHQLFFGDDAIWHRRWAGNSANWTGAVWNKLLTSADINGTVNYVSKFTGPSKLGDSQIFDNGTNVGIGTNTPTSKLTVNGTITAAQDLKANGDAFVTGMTATGTLETGTTANVGTNLTVGNTLTVQSNATVNNDLSVGNRLTVQNVAQFNNNASVAGALSVANATNLNGGAVINGSIGSNTLAVNGNSRLAGNVAIGTSPAFASGYRLSVEGKIITDEVRVALQADWPDYVFTQATPNPLEWERYIQQNQHLPGIPSAAEVQAQGGYDLGETQRLLLEKVEQLSLMVIEQQKQIDALKVQLADKK
jgi:cytoskeletal protein CcmA (bactofilin family)